MNIHAMPGIEQVLQAVHHSPAVSIILPFEPKMGLKKEITQSLKIAVDQVDRELQSNYPAELSNLVLQRLRNLVNSLNFNTHKKSVGIFVSPLFEKVLYLDIAVEKKVIVDDSFGIRDLVYSKKQLHKYLVLLLSSKESSMYIGNSTGLIRILNKANDSAKAFENDIPERVANFSDLDERKEILMHKFLHHVDQTLGLILQSHPLPLFILATERIAGHFKNITKHAGLVIEYVHGNYEDKTLRQLKEILEPYVADWKKVMQKDILNQLEIAAGKKRLSTGIRNVWREATNRKGSLLVVEKNYVYAARQGNTKIDNKAGYTNHSFSYIKDAVDDVIEKVLENGGDVEFTDDGLLRDYGRIALIQYN